MPIHDDKDRRPQSYWLAWALIPFALLTLCVSYLLQRDHEAGSLTDGKMSIYMLGLFVAVVLTFSSLVSWAVYLFRDRQRYMSIADGPSTRGKYDYDPYAQIGPSAFKIIARSTLTLIAGLILLAVYNASSDDSGDPSASRASLSGTWEKPSPYAGTMLDNGTGRLILRSDGRWMMTAPILGMDAADGEWLDNGDGTGVLIVDDNRIRMWVEGDELVWSIGGRWRRSR